MKFCSECGSNVENMKFCQNCGATTGALQNPSQPATASFASEEIVEKVLWEGRQQRFYGLNEKLKYKASNNIDLKIKDEFYQITNFSVRIYEDSTLNTSETLIDIRDITDVEVKQNMKDKVVGNGDVIIYTEGRDTYILKAVKNPNEAKSILYSEVQKFQRSRNVLYKKDSLR